MKYLKTITTLVVLIAVAASIATITGIVSNDGPGQYEYLSIRNRPVVIYGKGLYKDMSTEVAPQGIAQDYITLFAGIPLLLISLVITRKGSLTGRYLLAGTLAYFMVTYFFYTIMAMYNIFFLAYVLLMGASFYGFILTLLAFNTSTLQSHFKPSAPVKLTGGFLVFNCIAIALLWLSIVVPPLLDGIIIPVQAEHYTTLIVQALDLGILLPGGLVCGVLWLRKKTLGYLLAPIYLIFLSLLMCALTAKVIAMWMLGYNVIPVIFIIPIFNLLSITSATIVLRSIINTDATGGRIIHKQ